jgi:hypothetical protein
MKNKNYNLMRLGALARKLQLSPVWLREQAEKGIIPYLYAGGILLFNFESVKKTLADLAAKGSSNEK